MEFFRQMEQDGSLDETMKIKTRKYEQETIKKVIGKFKDEVNGQTGQGKQGLK